eukprot:12087006-Karenia_brevis.AAC.1
MLRRILAKFPHLQQVICAIAQKYDSLEYPGIHRASVDLTALSPAPPPGLEGRVAWKHETTPKGPVGLLIQHVHMLGATVDFDTFAIHTHLLPAMPILDTPFQLLKPTMLQLAFDAVHRAISHTRT